MDGAAAADREQVGGDGRMPGELAENILTTEVAFAADTDDYSLMVLFPVAGRFVDMPVPAVPVVAVERGVAPLVLALPAETWHRRVNMRPLPPAVYTRFALCSVDAVGSMGEGPGSDLVPDGESGTTNVVLVLCRTRAGAFVAHIDVDSEPDWAVGFTGRDGRETLPHARGLAMLASRHFGLDSYASAESGADRSTGGRPEREPGLRGASDDARDADTESQPAVGSRRGEASDRLDTLEENLNEMRAMMTSLVQGPAAATPSRGPELARPPPRGTAPKAAAVQAPSRATLADPLTAALDEARMLGVAESDLGKLASLIAGARTKIRPEPGPGGGPAAEAAAQNVALGTADLDEGEEDDDGLDRPGSTTMARAVVELTKLTKMLSGASSQPRDPLERALEGLTSLGGDAGATALSVRRGAQAHMLLKRAVAENPRALSRPILEAMRKVNRLTVFQHSLTEDGGGSDGLLAPDPLFWLEHRSRITNHKSNVMWAWQLGLVTRALLQGNHDEALTRCLLGLCAAEQLSLDHGRWTLAQEMLLIEAPPFGSFERHYAENHDQRAHTRLFDDRWVEVLHSRLREMDEMNERKKRLEGNARNLVSDPDKPPKPDPKRRPGGKDQDGKGKNKNDGGGSGH